MSLATEKVIILGTIPWLNPSGQPTYGKNSINLIKAYNHQIKVLAKRYNLLKPVDFYTYFKEYPEHLFDGVHPNSEGYQRMAELWFKHLIQPSDIRPNNSFR